MSILSRTQQNEIYAGIEANMLEPADFEWQVRTQKGGTFEPGEYLRLTHKPTGSYIEFSLTYGGDGHYITWRPMFPSGKRSDGSPTWTISQRIVVEWLRVVRADHNAPDLWGALKTQQVIPTTAADGGASQPFTANELTLLQAGLGDIERFIVTTGPVGPDDHPKLRRRFEYLKEAAKSGARRIDWLNIFVSQMLNLAVEGIIQPSFYRPLMSHSATVLSSVFQFGQKLLQAVAES